MLCVSESAIIRYGLQMNDNLLLDGGSLKS